MTKNERLSLPFWKKLILFLISFIFFAIQILLVVLMFDLTFSYNSYYKQVRILYFITMVIAMIYVIYIVQRPISANYKLIWAILIILFPLPSIMLYMFNQSSRKLSNRKMKIISRNIHYENIFDDKKDLSAIDPQAANHVNIVQHSTFAPVYKNVKYTFFNDCYEKFLDMLEELKKAEHYIFIETFIISSGYLMDQLFPILEEKGKNGVKIKILYDDVGSTGRVSSRLLKKLASIPNCKTNNYQPLGLNFNLMVNYRDHRKQVIIDGRVAYCGGDNLSDEYIHKKVRFGYWRDNCGKYEGPVVQTFVQMFKEMWFMSTRRILKNLYVPEYNTVESGYVMAFGDGPVNEQNPAYDLFTSLISSAKKSIYISTPYFIIDDSLIELIALKAKSGVDVCLLLPKIPDKKSVFYMSRGKYRQILKAGGRIFEFTPGFNHAKNIIIDDIYAFIGTINFDYRSLYLHYECGALIMHDKEIVKMSQDFVDAISKSEEIEYEIWRKRPWYQRLLAFILNILAPMF